MYICTVYHFLWKLTSLIFMRSDIERMSPSRRSTFIKRNELVHCDCEICIAIKVQEKTTLTRCEKNETIRKSSAKNRVGSSKSRKYSKRSDI